MMRRLLALLLVLPSLALATPVEPPMPELPGTSCDHCQNRGWTPCAHAWESLKSSTEPNVPKPGELDIGPLHVGDLFCSACLDLECCQGLGWKPCAACAPEATKRLREERIQARREFLRFRRDVVDKLLGVKPMHLRTEHFEVCFSLKPMHVEVWMDAKDRIYKDRFWHEEIQRLKLNKRRVKPSQHFMAHLWARRMEECYEQFCMRFDPDGTRPLATELAYDTMESYTPLRGEKVRKEGDKLDWSALKKGTPIREWVFLLGQDPEGPVSVLGGPVKNLDQKSFRAQAGAMFFSFYGKQDSGSFKFGTDAQYHQYVYHNVAECLVHDYVINGEEYRGVRRGAGKGLRTPYNDLPDWVHEGWARVQEMDRFGEAIVHCTAEVANTDFQAGKRSQYVEHLKKWLGAKRLSPLPEIMRSIRDRFGEKVHVQIWYILDYLRRRDPQAFPRLIARSKMIACELNDEKEGFTRALDEVYGLTPLGLEDAWREDLLKQR